MESFANEAATLAALKAQIVTAITVLNSTNVAKMQYVAECKAAAKTAEDNQKTMQDKIAGR